MVAPNQKKKSGVKSARVNREASQLPTDELLSNRQGGQDRLFEELTRHADAVDQVLMEKGEPEYDWASG